MKKTKHNFRVKRDSEPFFNANEIVILRRNILNISQSLFAELIGVSPRAVTSWECGWRKPSASTLTILKFYKKNPHLILEKIGEKNER